MNKCEHVLKLKIDLRFVWGTHTTESNFNNVEFLFVLDYGDEDWDFCEHLNWNLCSLLNWDLYEQVNWDLCEQINCDLCEYVFK